MRPRSEFGRIFDVADQFSPAIHQPQVWNYDIPHSMYEALMWPTHDVGGQPQLPEEWVEEEEEEWEANVYVTCECLGWRGHWNSEERRRRADNDVGLTLYMTFPYYGRWIWAAARMLVDNNKISVLELQNKIAEVRARYAKG